MNIQKLVFSGIAILIFCVGIIYTPMGTYAQELPSGLVIGDNKGINATKNGEYHVSVTDVLPGKKWHTTISIVNMEKDIPYQLTMLISPPKVSGSLDLSLAIQMKLTYNGNVVYEGPASGISKTQNLQTTPLDLGVFSAGDSRALEVDYSLSGDYTKQDFVQKNVMDNVWTYSAVKTIKPVDSSNPNNPDDPKQSSDQNLLEKALGKFPSTGEAVKQGMIFLCIGLFLLLIVLLMWKKRKREE